MIRITKTQGFTLIELLVVIAIIGILAVAFLPNVLGAPAKARDAQRIADLNKIANAMLAQSIVSSPVSAAIAGTTFCHNATSGPSLATGVRNALGIITPPSGTADVITCNPAGQYLIQVAPASATSSYKFAVVARLEQALSVPAGSGTNPGARACPTTTTTTDYSSAAVGAPSLANDCYVVFVR